MTRRIVLLSMLIAVPLTLSCDGGMIVTDECAHNDSRASRDGELEWGSILPDRVPAPPGWQVRDDPGEGPFMTVTAGARAVGSIELQQVLLPSNFDPNRKFAALKAWAEEFYASVEQDRQAGDFEGIPRFQAFPVEDVSFGAYCGASYAYTVLDETAHAAIELFIGHATFDPQKLYLVTAFYDKAQAPDSGFVDEASLQTYAPFLGELVENLRVPSRE